MRVACLILLVCSTFVTAAPTLTHLSPAGGQRGQTITVTAAGTFAKAATVWISGQGISATPSKIQGQFDIAIAADAIPGVRAVRIIDDTGASEQRAFIVGTLPEIPENEPNNLPAKPHEIAKLPVVVNGKLEKSGDVDCFGVTLNAGETLVAGLEANRTLKSPIDAVLQLVSPDGFVQDQVHDFDGLDPLLAFTAPKTGRYIVRLFAFPSTPDSSIRFFGSDACIYRLTLTTGAYAIGTRPLMISAKDSNVRFVGWNPGDRMPKIDRGDFATLWHPEVATSIARPITTVPTFDLDAIQPDSPLVPPYELTGILTKPVPVRVPIVLEKSQKVNVTLGPGISSSPFAPLLNVLNADGQSVAKAEPSKPSGDATTTLTGAGKHTIEIRDQYRQAGPRLLFQLSVAGDTPSFSLTVPSDRFTLIAGQPLEIPVTITRAGGFAGAVKLQALGLPDTVKVEVLPPKEKPEVAKQLTLKLTTDKPGVQSSFGIVGESASLANAKIRARAAADNPAPFALWLTSVAKK